jgi:ABC-type uncharacterized transport system permease subunit
MLSSRNRRRSLEAILLPMAAILVALMIFGLFCALAGANPFAVYGSIYRAAFGSWSAWQNTLIRASPLMLTALCTALPARLGLVVIGNEGALVMGGLAAILVGLSLGTSICPALGCRWPWPWAASLLAGFGSPCCRGAAALSGGE